MFSIYKAKYHCNYCDENICNVRVRCNECTDFDLCLKCFSSGAEIGSHRKRHAYQLIDCGTFEIFSCSTESGGKKWKASEEISLLEAVELHGFGNWRDISEYLRSHSPDDIEKHFLTYYTYGNIGQLIWPSVKDNLIDVIDNTSDSNENDDDDEEEEDGGDNWSVKVDDSEPLPEDSQLLGYMPKRDDYEREYDNEAETLVSFLSVQNEEDSIDKDLKLTSMEIFNRRLCERLRRKNIASDYKLIDAFFKEDGHNHQSNHQPSPLSASHPVCANNIVNTNLTQPKQHTPFHKKDTLNNDLKIFSQFQSYSEQMKLISNLKKETELKSRIKDLHRYRRNGITRLIECNHFESGRFKRDKKKENKKKMMCLGEYGRKYWLRSETAKDTSITAAAVKSPTNKSANKSKKISGLFEPRILRAEQQQRQDVEQQHAKRNRLKRFKCLGLGPFRSKRRQRRTPGRFR